MKSTVTDNDPTIDIVRQQFQDWRSSRIKRAPISEHLWQAAEFTQIDLKSLFPQESPWQLFCQRCDGSILKLSGSGGHPPVSEILKGFLS